MSGTGRLGTWWDGLDEVTRRRVSKLGPDALLPADVAAGLREAGIALTGVGTDAHGEPLWAQPAVLLELLAERRRGRTLSDPTPPPC